MYILLWLTTPTADSRGIVVMRLQGNRVVVWHEFLSSVTSGGLKTRPGLGGAYPTHKDLAMFLCHFLKESDIYGPLSPFNKDKWDDAANKQISSEWQSAWHGKH